MAGPVGFLSILLALGAALAGAALAGIAAHRESQLWLKRAETAALVMLALVGVAIAVMVHALVTHNFSVEYVAQVGSRKTPLLYTVISLWSALEGSILLWALLLAAYTCAVVIWRRRAREFNPIAPWALGTLFLINIFFLLVIAWPANPFERVSPVPADGPGPNALLQNNPFMAVHPPLLYLGYVGMSVPFAFAVGGLITGRFDREWTRTMRRWTLVPWGFLSLGIVAGMWWSYEVLGWGGYWAWDPVENASFLPWLTGTAFLHSMMVQERRGMLKSWTMSLISATFLLTILGTFLTRSGVVQSVHAFTASLIGPFFLAFFGLGVVASITLIAWRADQLSSEGNLDSPFSRETAFLANNLLFTTFTFTVLLGTLFPILAQVARGENVSVGAPFYNQMTLPVMLALVFLLGVGPALPWGVANAARFRGKLLRASIPAALGLAVFATIGLRHPIALLTIVLALFAAGLVAAEFGEPMAIRRSHGESFVTAFWRVLRVNPRRYGGYIVHFGVLVMALGIAISSAYKREGSWTLRPGQSTMFRGYRLQLDSLWVAEEAQRDAVIMGLSVYRGDRMLDRMFPRLNYYPTSMEPIATPAVREGVREDLYLVLAAFEENGAHATLHAIISPMVFWIWAGALVLAAGVVLGLMPPALATTRKNENTPRRRVVAQKRKKVV